MNKLHRESILDPNRTFGSNSELNKTMSAMGGTIRIGNTFASKIVKTNPAANILPSIAIKDPVFEDPKFLTKSRVSKSLLNKEASKTTLNIMNVTFNSRPGVK